MSDKDVPSNIVLSVDPRINKIGFVWLLRQELLDWGIKLVETEPTRKQARQVTVARVVELLDACSPDVLILPKVGLDGDYRSKNVIEVIHAITREAQRRGIAIHSVTMDEVKDRLSGVAPLRPHNKTDLRDLAVLKYPQLKAFTHRARRRSEYEQH